MIIWRKIKEEKDGKEERGERCENLMSWSQKG